VRLASSVPRALPRALLRVLLRVLLRALLRALPRVLLLAALAVARTAIADPAPAGSRILNQASATYVDAGGAERNVTSNVVETVVRQSAGVSLTASQSRLAVPATDVVFSHTLTNTGNGPDAFALSVTNASGDDVDFSSVSIFADADQDGIADGATPLSSSPTLGPGQAFHIVVLGRMPGGVSGGTIAELELRASSDFNASIGAGNTDRATVATRAVIDVFKSISARGGPSPGGPYTVTLGYRNASSTAASDLTLIDALPGGMSYVPGSGRWSVTGTQPLSDADATDTHGGAPDTVRFCAYDVSCAGLPESDRDADGDSANQVTAIVAGVAPGAAGSLSFQVTIDAGLAAGALSNAAEHEYGDGASTVARARSNTVDFEVSGASGVVANGSTTSAVDGEAEPVVVASAPQGSTVTFANTVWNTGNETDTLDIVIDTDSATFPPDTVFRLLRSDGATPLLDSDGDGIADTGPLSPGSGFPIVVQAILPAGAAGDNDGAGFVATTIARSSNAPDDANPVSNRLGAIAPGTVDLTNDAAAGEVDALGTGGGPEADAVKVVTAAPGTTARFVLHVANTGGAPEAFELAASTDGSFAELALPPGWSVTFRSADDADTISATDAIAPGDSVAVFADVSVPSEATPGERSLYFRVLSPGSGTRDVIHDAIVVSDAATLLLEPGGRAQAEPGDSIVYAHRLANTGNAPIAGIALSTDDERSARGWQSSVHEDANGDGVFDAGDRRIDAIDSLGPGESRVLFVEVFAPPAAPEGAVNATTLSATWQGGGAVVAVDDVTTITSGDILIVKEQAPDIGCDGTLDGAYTHRLFAVEPGGNCVRYRLTATNAGTERVFNAVIEDATPPFTAYRAPASCSDPGCTITEPGDGGTGRVAGEIDAVGPGESVVLIFAVMIE